MDEMRIVGRCVSIAVGKWLGSKKSIAILGISVLFGAYAYLPLIKAAAAFHETIPPVLFIFFYSFFTLQILYGGVCTLLYSDILTTDEYTLWSIQRAGRKNYMTGLCLFVFLLAAMYTLLHFFISFLITIPVIGSLKDWGKILRTMSTDPTVILKRIGNGSNVAVASKIINKLTPFSAVLFSSLLIWLTTSFMGMIQLFFTVFMDRMTGIIVSGICISMTFFSMYLGRMTIGGWLFYISPLSWINISILDWYKTKDSPSPAYAVIFLLAGNLIMGILSVIRYNKKDTL